MSDYQQRERRPGTGVLLTNRFKKNAQAPDWRGELKIDNNYQAGDVIQLAAWTKETSGGVLISLKEDTYVRPEGEVREVKTNRNPIPSKRVTDDDDVPF
jgi:hypothetical protein